MQVQGMSVAELQVRIKSGMIKISDLGNDDIMDLITAAAGIDELLDKVEQLESEKELSQDVYDNLGIDFKDLEKDCHRLQESNDKLHDAIEDTLDLIKGFSGVNYQHIAITDILAEAIKP